MEHVVAGGLSEVVWVFRFERFRILGQGRLGRLYLTDFDAFVMGQLLVHAAIELKGPPGLAHHAGDGFFKRNGFAKLRCARLLHFLVPDPSSLHSPRGRNALRDGIAAAKIGESSDTQKDALLGFVDLHVLAVE